MAYDNRYASYSAARHGNNPRSPSPLVRIAPQPPIPAYEATSSKMSPLLRSRGSSPVRPPRRGSHTDVFATYTKMIDVGVPDQTVEDVMILDGFTDADIDTFFMNLDGQDNFSDTGTHRSRASSYVIDFEKYETMLRLGISDDAIIVEMERDGFSPDDIADFFEIGPVSQPPARNSHSYSDHAYYDDYYDDEDGYEDDYGGGGGGYDDYPYDGYDEYDDGYDYDMPEIDPRYPSKYSRDDDFRSNSHSKPIRGDPPVSNRGGINRDSPTGRAPPVTGGRGQQSGKSAREVGKADNNNTSSRLATGGNASSSGSGSGGAVHAKPVTSAFGKLVRAVPFLAARSRPVVKLNLPPPRRKGDVKTATKLDEKNTLHFKKMIEVIHIYICIYTHLYLVLIILILIICIHIHIYIYSKGAKKRRKKRQTYPLLVQSNVVDC